MTRTHAGREPAAHGGRLLAVFSITLATLAVQVVGSLLSGSLALLADAGHLGTDVAALGLALLAAWFARRPASASKTFGYRRVEILAAAVNAVLLLGVAGFVLVEASRRLADPPEVQGAVMLAVALGGLAANAVCLWLLHPAQARSLNLRGAYLEVLGDLLGSAAVVAAALVILVTGVRAADPVASGLVALAILPRTWHLLREAVDVLLEGAPRDVDLDEVRRHIRQVPGVTGCHDLHAWTITSGMPVLSAHVVVSEGTAPGRVLDALGDCLGEHFDIEHSTFQLEPAGHRDHEGRTCP